MTRETLRCDVRPVNGSAAISYICNISLDFQNKACCQTVHILWHIMTPFLDCYYCCQVVMAWLGLGTKNIWLCLGKDQDVNLRKILTLLQNKMLIGQVIIIIHLSVLLQDYSTTNGSSIKAHLILMAW